MKFINPCWIILWITERKILDVYGAETGIFQSNQVNIMVADALAPYVARSSATMVLIM